MNGASAALMISQIPLPTPVGAVRIGKVEGNFVVNPQEDDLVENTDLDLIVAGTEEAILMVEAGANEIPEAEILDALDIAHGEIKKLCAAQRELAAQAGKEKLQVEVPQVHPELYEQIKASHGAALDAATQVEDKLARQDACKAVEEQVITQYAGDPESETYAEFRANAQRAFDKLEKTLIRERIAVQKKRPDGRGSDEIRPISVEVGVAPRTHGSAIFTRGQTQALSVIALGTTREEMRLDTLGLETAKRYWHHYNFPPFSVGEAGFMRGPKRRDIGHGALAERALVPMIPSQEEFPYTIRVVSDILESNGSSSMASVCGSTLSLMDAGVPIKAPVAGIAMGLSKEGDAYLILTDIAGQEDAFGDMDFKVAGTSEFVTALQLDTKIEGIPADVLAGALQQAKEARLQILDVMLAALPAPRDEVSSKAPRIITIQIPVDKIGEVIGPKGKKINEIIAMTGADINIEDDGTVFIGSREAEGTDEAARMIEEIANPRPVLVGETYEGIVVKTTTFGAFVNLVPGRDGLVHISKLGRGKRLSTVEEAVKEGDRLTVLVEDVDPQGKISLKPVGPEWEVPEGTQVEPAGERRDRGGDRGRDRGPRGDRGDRHGRRFRDGGGARQDG